MATDAELLALAEQATPNGATPIGAGDVDPAPLARQVPPGTPGAVEGPVQMPQDNPTDLGVDPNPQPKWFTPEDAAKETAGNADPNIQQAPVLAPSVPPPAPADNFQAPPLKTGRPTMANASQALDQATQAGFDSAKAQTKVGEAKGEERSANATVLDTQAKQYRQNLSEIEQKERAQEEGRQRAQAIADKAEQEYRDYKIHDYLKERSGAERLRSNIFIGLGAAGEALSGVAGNPALEKLKMIVDSDFKRQAAELGQKDNFAKMKREGVTSLEAGYKSQLATLQLKQASALDAVAAEAKAQALRNGATVEQAENNVIVSGLKQKALELRAKGQEQLWDAQSRLAMAGAQLELARQKNDQPTQQTAAQAKAYDFAGRLQRDSKILSDLGQMSPKGAQILREQLAYEDSVKPEGKAALIAAGKWRTIEQALSESGDPKDVDRYVAGHRMATSSLRPDSGAAISGSEYLGWATDHIPQPGDTKSSLDSKLKARDGLVQGQANASGRPEDFGYASPGGVDQHPKASGAEKQAPKTTSKPGPAKVPEAGGKLMKLKDGRVGMVYPGGIFVESK